MACYTIKFTSFTENFMYESIVLLCVLLIMNMNQRCQKKEKIKNMLDVVLMSVVTFAGRML
jgi:hypothetical protein